MPNNDNKQQGEEVLYFEAVPVAKELPTEEDWYHVIFRGQPELMRFNEGTEEFENTLQPTYWLRPVNLTATSELDGLRKALGGILECGSIKQAEQIAQQALNL